MDELRALIRSLGGRVDEAHLFKEYPTLPTPREVRERAEAEKLPPLPILPPPETIEAPETDRVEAQGTRSASRRTSATH